MQEIIIKPSRTTLVVFVFVEFLFAGFVLFGLLIVTGVIKTHLPGWYFIILFGIAFAFLYFNQSAVKRPRAVINDRGVSVPPRYNFPWKDIDYFYAMKVRIRGRYGYQTVLLIAIQLQEPELLYRSLKWTTRFSIRLAALSGFPKFFFVVDAKDLDEVKNLAKELNEELGWQKNVERDYLLKSKN